MSTNEKSKTILFGALDWGLGHATRSMPLIDALISLGHTVILAGSGDAATLWRTNYPHLQQLSLAENEVVYGKNASWSALWQSPRFILNIQRENQHIQNFVLQQPVDLIVSDNRYGLYHPKIPSILMTHQLQLLPPDSWSLIQKVWKTSWKSARKTLYAPFQEIWIPDYASENHNLGGELSHDKIDKPVRYIGPLSRLKPVQFSGDKSGLLLLLSGPEPQRSLLELQLLEQPALHHQSVTLVRGLAGRSLPLPKQASALNHLTSYDFLDGEALSQNIASHSCVIARSGYSTLMDLQQLGARGVFIPTPGQAEQEYLAHRLASLGIAAFHHQNKLNLSELLAENAHNSGFKANEPSDLTQLWRETLSSLVA